jgi:DNA-binding ferritin-like protein (Dps family)
MFLTLPTAHLRYMERSVKKLIFSFEKTSLVEDMVELGMREKQMDAAANITAQVPTSRPENYEMIERYLARVKMKIVDTMLTTVEVVGMYEKANMGGRSLSTRTQLEVEAVLGLDLQV